MAKQPSRNAERRMTGPSDGRTDSTGTTIGGSNRGRGALPIPRNRAQARLQIHAAIERNLTALRALSKL